jgi:hypothetical protein
MQRHDASLVVEDDHDAIVLDSLTEQAWSGRPIVLVILVNRQIEIVWLEYFWLWIFCVDLLHGEKDRRYY